MKLHPEDPRLTSFLLGELADEEVTPVQEAIAEDPALQEALRELEGICKLLKTDLAPIPNALLPEQRTRILAAARSDKPSAKPLPGRSPVRWLVPLAAAAVVTGGIFLFLSPQHGKPGTSADHPSAPKTQEEETMPDRVRMKPAPPRDANNAIASANMPAPPVSLPPLKARGYVAAVDFPTLDLPVQSGTSSLEWIRRAVLTRHERPKPEEVRIEEILNSFNLRPAGLTVISKLPSMSWHPDDRGAGLTSHSVTISAESISCPWKPSATLTVISLRGNPTTDCNIKAVFRVNPANVARYRLLGFSTLEGEQTQPMPTLLPAKGSHIIALEIEPSGTAAELGNIEWSVNEAQAAPVTIARPGPTEPSDDARFAALICTYAQWLANDPKGLIDTEMLAALARESASESLSGDRAEFLHLIDQSLGF